MLTDGLKHWWKLESDSADSHGTPPRTGGDTAIVHAADGAAFTHAGTSAIDLTSVIATKLGSPVFSIAGRINPGTQTASEGAVFADSGRGLYFNTGTAKLKFYDAAAAPLVDGGALTLGAVVHFAVTLSGSPGTLKFYVNGVLTATHAAVTWPVGGVGSGFGFWRMGNDTVGSQFVGKLRQIGYWERELEASQVATLANAGAPLSYEEVTTPAISAKVAGYSRQLVDLFPTGRAWSREADAQITKVRTALVDELARVDDRGVDLIEESDPRTATETLADWERVLRIPDEQILEVPATDADRRVAITSKFTGIRGGQNVAFFVNLGAACGYEIEISRYQDAILRSGRARSGDRAMGALWGYSMLVTVSPPAGAALTHAQLEAVIRKHTHSHIAVVFEYL